jgi:hypothetical protein
MVHLKDEGSHFDAPLDTVWKYLQAPDAHGPSHRTTRNQQIKPLGENSMLVTMEQNMNGTWVRVANRITVMPPLGMAIEVLEGPMAGSKMFNVYTAKGHKTGIDVYGEFVSAQVPAPQLEPMVRGFLDTIFAEDVAGIKAFAAKK